MGTCSVVVGCWACVVVVVRAVSSMGCRCVWRRWRACIVRWPHLIGARAGPSRCCSTRLLGYKPEPRSSRKGWADLDCGGRCRLSTCRRRLASLAAKAVAVGWPRAEWGAAQAVVCPAAETVAAEPAVADPAVSAKVAPGAVSYIPLTPPTKREGEVSGVAGLFKKKKIRRNWRGGSEGEMWVRGW